MGFKKKTHLACFTICGMFEKMPVDLTENLSIARVYSVIFCHNLLQAILLNVFCK